MQGNTPQNQGSAGQSGQGKPTLSWTSSQQKITPPSTPPIIPPAQPSKNNPNNNAKINPQKSNMPTYAGIFVGGLVIGVLVGWGAVGTRSTGTNATVNTDNQASSTTTQTTGTGTTMDLSGSTVGAGDLTISSPQNSGLEVAVAHVNVSVPTWVIVYEDHNGVPGNALGATLFFPAAQGGATSGAVSLLRGTLPGQTYLVGEALDDGDHKFSMNTDKPVRDSKGNPVLVQFKTN
jgi:hypothetical protein